MPADFIDGQLAKGRLAERYPGLRLNGDVSVTISGD
jgi:hypothetical protein